MVALTQSIPPRPPKAPDPFRISGTAQVDGETWYSIVVYGAEIRAWIRGNDCQLWYQGSWSHANRNAISFDIHEQLYTLLALRWL